MLPSHIMLLIAFGMASCGGSPNELSTPVAESLSDSPPEPLPPPGETPSSVSAIGDDPCEQIEERVRQVWSDEILASLDLSVKIYEGEMKAVDAELAVSRLKDFSVAWVEIRKDACSRQDTDLESILACLDDALSTQKVVVGDIREGVKMAIAQAQTLPELLKRCDDEGRTDGEASDMRNNPF